MMTRSPLAAAALALAVAAPLHAQTEDMAENPDALAQEEENDRTGTPFTPEDLITSLRGGAQNPDEAFDGMAMGDGEVIVVRLSELDGIEESIDDLDADLTENARDFVEYHRQIADPERDYLNSGIADAGYNVEDVVGWWQGGGQIVLVVDDRNRL